MAATETRVASVTSELYKLFVSPEPQASATERPALARARRASTPLPLPESVGCALKGVTKTVFSISVSSKSRLDAMLRLAKPAMDVALQNGNDVHLVFLGAQNVSAPSLVELKKAGYEGIAASNVHLVPGNLSGLTGLPRNQTLEYLHLCKPVLALGGEGPEAVGGLWALARGQAVAHSERLAWRDNGNARWEAMLNDVTMLGDKEFQQWLDTQPAKPPPPPPAGFLQDGSTLVQPSSSLVACTRRRLRVSDQIVMSECEWHELSPCSWHMSTWCGSTASALTPAPIGYMDKSASLDELQYDVNVVLSTLIQAGSEDFLALEGVLGPCVLAGRNENELLRIVEWHSPTDDTGYITLLPEAYARFALSDYDSSFVELTSPGPHTVLSSFLVLPDDDLMLLRFPDLTSAEQVEAAKELGNRVWKLPLKRVPFPAVRASATPGKRIDTVEHQTVFFAASDSSDPLEGLVVRWVFAPGGRDLLPTLDSANSAFETPL